MKSVDIAEKTAWLQLLRTENVGSVTFFNLLQLYGTAQNALENLQDIAQRGGSKKPLIVPPIALAQQEIEYCYQHDIAITLFCEASYPALLKQIDAPPPILFLQGDIALLQRPCIAIVGARNASSAGRQFAAQLAAEIGAAGVTIVSGLARGIDTAAHQASLDSGTVGVVAGGVDYIYPPENRSLQEKMAQQGLLVSENPSRSIPQAKHFPRRNRIISGVSLATIVVEAAPRSGSLITAKFALNQGREVLAVPGNPLDPRCGGTNKLIKEGAILLESAADALDIVQTHAERQQRFSLQERKASLPAVSATIPQDIEVWRQKVIALLSATPVSVDVIIRDSQALPAVVQMVLLELDLAGRLQNHTGGKVSLIF